MTTPPSTRPPSGEVVSRGGSHLARNAAIAVGLVLVVFIVVLATRPTGDDAVNTTAVGRAVPPVVGTTLDGETYDIDRFRGDWVVVNFFATWCTPCIVEHPELVRFSEEHAAAGDGVSIVAVQFGGEEERTIREFFEQRGGDWPVLVGEGTGRIALDFGVTAVPESYLVAPNGQVVAKYVSGVTAAGLDAEIDRYEAAGDDDQGEDP
ncbi:TlpA family protein disulfide reductase [Rhabdothermincola salaria]|uniref:TlpA family protein disulfide reductase n=1 Tax=Rhabdothermincola salaria TaxID=2903142 RepID=UPI001E4D059A|nr:TlpA disulfide reductase family protein [Rhabdothermincola salaria]MCD9625119.1 TlpA family protein disulfide reductase [Rhabdothermincola salaria]